MTTDKINFQIRLAKDSDLAIIEHLWIDGLLQIHPDIVISNKIRELFRRNFKNRSKFFNFWVAETTSIIGWCSILPAFSHPLKQNSSAEVSTYIDKGMSKNGVGTHLMQFVFDELKDKEIDNVFGFANPKNIKSIKMCENAGMRICGETSTRVILIREYL